MKIRVENCSHSPSSPSRFEAGEGDIVLLRNEISGFYYEAKICSIKSSECLLVSFMDGADEIRKQILPSDIKTLMLTE